MDKLFHPTLSRAFYYLSMLGLKLNDVSKRGPSWCEVNILTLLFYSGLEPELEAISVQLCAGNTNKWWLTHSIASGLIPRASYQIRKIAGAHAPGMQGTFLPPPRVSDPDMHHGTCVTHVPWCMPGSLTIGFLWSRRRGETFPTFPAHARSAVLRFWPETHGTRAAIPVNKISGNAKNRSVSNSNEMQQSTISEQTS